MQLEPVDNSIDRPDHRWHHATGGSGTTPGGGMAQRHEAPGTVPPNPLVDPSPHPSFHPASSLNRDDEKKKSLTVWVESPQDRGSAVWGCTHCHTGAWCPNFADARGEAARHARAHGTTTTLLTKPGPKPNQARDTRIHTLRTQGLSLRAIAALVGITHAGVKKALTRT